MPLWEGLTKPFCTVDVELKQETLGSVVLGQREVRAVGEQVLRTSCLSWEACSGLCCLHFPQCGDAGGGEREVTHSPTFLHLNLCLIYLSKVQYIIFVHGLC